MVTRQPEPNTDPIAYLDAIVDERQNGVHATFFDGIREEWKERASEYRREFGNPEVIKPWNAVAGRKLTFNNLYLSPSAGSIQGGVIATLRARTLQLCPACGEEGAPNTLDHYLPKELYPEFSILPQNLLPMCDGCQGKKKSKTVDAANQRMFIHAYYDNFVNQQIVSLTIGEPYGAPASIDLLPTAGLSAEEAALVSRHVAELEIINRYHHFFRDEHLRLMRLVNNLRRTEQNVQQQVRNFRDWTALRSVNSWPHIFYSGVLANPDLMEFLEHGQLPEV